MTLMISRINEKVVDKTQRVFCDCWISDGQRGVDHHPSSVIGQWPDKSETNAILRLADALYYETSDWQSLAKKPPIVQNLSERASLQPLDIAILRDLHHLQQVLHQPRLNLRVVEERVRVSSARRTPIRAIADLISHPGNWERRTLQGIQPVRVLARQVEDNWNLYENRVAVRLVDYLIEYLANRLKELNSIYTMLLSADHSGELQNTSYNRRRRLTDIWSEVWNSDDEKVLKDALHKLKISLERLEALLDTQLYKQIPLQASVALALKPTNILVHDQHYRHVAVLWRAWLKYGDNRQETRKQKADRHMREADSWDQYVLHLVVRGFSALGWEATPLTDQEWHLWKSGWKHIRLLVNSSGRIEIKADQNILWILPIFAGLTDTKTAEPAIVEAELKEMDKLGAEITLAHFGLPCNLDDTDRASGWAINGCSVLFACSPYQLDSEERMTRLLNGWLNRKATLEYPFRAKARALPQLPNTWSWIEFKDDELRAYRSPTKEEIRIVEDWTVESANSLDIRSRRTITAMKRHGPATLKAINEFVTFTTEAQAQLAGLAMCPVCPSEGNIEPRPGKSSDGTDATWWASCPECTSQWGTRRCTTCGAIFRVLIPNLGLDVKEVSANIDPCAWPDKIYGSDLWAQPCKERPTEWFRCPECGHCPR